MQQQHEANLRHQSVVSTMADETAQTKVHPAVQQGIQYTLSSKEYAYVYQKLLRRLSVPAQSKLPSPARYAKLVETRGDFNAATVRVSIRAFLAVQAIFQIYDYVVAKLAARKGQRSIEIRLPLRND